MLARQGHRDHHPLAHADLQRDLARHHQAAQDVIAARIGAQGMAVRARAQGGLRQVHMDLIGVVEERPDEAEQL
jgi:hypothetical protein